MIPILVGPIMPHRGYFAWPYTSADGRLRRSRRFIDRSAAAIARGLLADRHHRAGREVLVAEDEVTLARHIARYRIALPRRA